MGQGHPLLGPDGRDWALGQLKAAGYEQTNVYHVSRKVLDTLMPYLEADPEKAGSVLPVLSRLLSGSPLTEDFWEETQRANRTWDWIQALPRMLHEGDNVRVRVDAYTDARARENGLEGVVVAIRNGIVVNYDGATSGMGWRHTSDKLEKRVPARR